MPSVDQQVRHRVAVTADENEVIDLTGYKIQASEFLGIKAGIVLHSVEAIRALDKTKDQSAFVLDYYEDGNGYGGGAYVCDLADEVSADNGGTIIVAADGARWKMTTLAGLNVCQFGAILGGAEDEDEAAANRAAFAAAWAWHANGGEFIAPPGDYYFGAYAASSNVVTVANPKNVKLNAYGARFLVKTTDEMTPFLFNLVEPNNVVIAGARFKDVGFNPASWLSHGRWGMGAICVRASNACRGLRVTDCEFENLTYCVVGDFSAAGDRRKFSGLTFDNNRAKNCYYGVDMIYMGDGLEVQNFECTDVRRTVIAFGPRKARIHVKLHTNAGFLGSNAAISIANEGEAVVGADANVEGVHCHLEVSGVEAHEAYIHYYFTQNDSAGYIANCSAKLDLNNLTAVGKNGALGATDGIRIDHELPSTAILGNTSRQIHNLELDVNLKGAITGRPIGVDSVNTVVPFTIALSPTTTRLVESLAVTSFSTYTDFLTPFEKPLALVPVGATTPGVPTGLVQKGAQVKMGKLVYFDGQLSWTAHTGTGPLRLNGLTYARNDAVSDLASIEIYGEGLSHTAGTTLEGLIGGVGNSQILIMEESLGNIAAVNVDGVVGGLRVKGFYFTP